MQRRIFPLVHIIFFPVLIFSSLPGSAQVIHWDGGGGDGLWMTPQNWSGDLLPQPGDEVVLDHAVVAVDYKVILPEGNLAVSVKSLHISPSNGLAIELEVPKANTAVPAFSATAAPGIVLGNGAVFRNASGASSGNVVVVSDSLRILEGGRFVQQSETAHANLVSRLSVASVTALGCFEFNVPGGSSYTISVSNRTYGHLSVNAYAAGGTKNYLSSGTNPFLIRGDFQVGAGVTYALNTSGQVRIKQNVVVRGTLNLSSGTRSNKILVEGNLDCAGTITETGSGEPQLEFGGPSTQYWSQSGNLLNHIVVRMNNSAGVRLQTPVRIPYKFVLLAGGLDTSPEHLLILNPGCLLECDSLNAGAFVNGPLQRMGLTGSGYACYPVGKQGRLRWLSLHAAKGDITVTYVRNQPAALSPQLGEGLHHLAEEEYWTIAGSDLSGAAIELPFEANFSNTVDQWSEIRVAGLRENAWQDFGNVQLTGSGTGAGTVKSKPAAFAGSGINYVTLGAGNPGQQTLPLDNIYITVTNSRSGVVVEGVPAPGSRFVRMAVEGSADGVRFRTLFEEAHAEGVSRIRQLFADGSASGPFYRIAAATAQGELHYSEIRSSRRSPQQLQQLQMGPNPAGREIYITLHAAESGYGCYSLYDLRGRLVWQQRALLQQGVNRLALALGDLPAGPYCLSAQWGTNQPVSQWIIRAR